MALQAQQTTYQPVPAPEPGMWTEVSDGVHWARIPLPFKLDHVNVWLVEDECGWALFDCGIDSEPVREIWSQLLSSLPGSRPITRIIATHGHTDHVGCAGYLVDRLGVPFAATRIEWLSAQTRPEMDGVGTDSDNESFLLSHGCPLSEIPLMREEADAIWRYLGPMPPAFAELHGGDTLRIGARLFRVMVQGGHADAHAVFHCPEDGLLLVGDQVLARISPVVAVLGRHAVQDPLGQYLASLEALAAIPADTLVLPGHGAPFSNLRARIEQLKSHHADRLSELEQLLAGSMSAYAAAGKLFKRAFDSGHRRLALGETLAHLHRLDRDVRVVSTPGPRGVMLWRRTSGAIAWSA